MKHLNRLHVTICLLLLSAFACGIPAAQNPQADPNVFNTQVAQTAAAFTPLVGNTAVPSNNIQPSQTTGDDSAIKQALAAYLQTNAADIQFTLTANNGSAAHGMVVPSGAIEGAAWFAGKDSSGQWVIAHIGQGLPLCAAIQPYNFPLEYVSHCEDVNGNVVDRAGGESSAPPSTPTPASPSQADAFAPDPLGAAWTGFWIAQGECYDLDLFSAINDATCDLSLDANNTFTPQNGGTFDASPYQEAPSLNTCKSAALGLASMNAAQITYVCFKTNAGRYGFFIPREVQAGGVVFYAYLFP